MVRLVAKQDLGSIKRLAVDGMEGLLITYWRKLKGRLRDIEFFGGSLPEAVWEGL